MGFIIDGKVNIDADISKFSSKMDEIETKYAKAKEKVESEKISTAPLSDDRTKGDVESSYDYMLNSFSQAKTVLESLQNVGTSLPQNIQKAISSLVGGIDQSLSSLTGSVTTAGKKMKTSFNDVGFNNSIRFASESVQSYAKDLQQAIESAQALSKRSRTIVDQNIGQIAAAVSPAISRMSIHDKANMSDAQIVEQMMTGRDYSHIPALLSSIGLKDAKQMREALNLAVKTSNSRIYRRDAGMGYRYAGIKGAGDPVLVSDMVQGAYKDALFTGGRYVDEKVTPMPKSNGAIDKEKTRAYYQAIRREIMRGNSVAYNAAKESGLIEQTNGEYSFAREGSVLNNPSMLNQFAGLVTREAHHALQGQPQHRRRLDDPSNQSILLGKDSTRIREARYLMNLDQRPDAAPYVTENYQIPEGIGYRTGKRMAVPELKIPETINIPRMTVRQTSQGPQLMIPRRNKDNNLVYEPDLNFQWQKQGLQEALEDEWITMGRNPIIDRLERLSKRTDLKPQLKAAISGFKFEDRTFGRGYDKNNEAATGAPLIVDVPLDYFYDKNKYGEMQFRTKENGERESYFSGDNETLINEMYKGNIRPVLSYGGKKLDYRVFAGKTTGGGSLKLMLNDAYEAIEQEDRDRGLPSILNFFNELGPNGKLINPKTGKEFENTESANAAYARWFDARNKILSHSTPIESLGGKTPNAALVNLEAVYDAMNMPKNRRFDGGGFIAPDVYTQDFQARMGPAKFLAQRFDWKKWFQDTGYAYQGGEFEGDQGYHFFMPGMATSSDDYKKYRAALQGNVGLGAKSFNVNGQTIDFGGQTFKDWRDQRFVDVMSDDFKAVLFDTTLKSTAKLSSVTPEQYQRIVQATQGKEGTSFTTEGMMQARNGMVPLTTKQQTELFGMMADPEYGFGLRLMKDTENYAGKKDFWSPAYMSSVMMTPALMRQSQENYEKAFQELSTPEGIIKRMFSGHDIDSLRVQKDPSLIYRDKFIQQAVQAEINDLEDKQMRGYAYMPGSAQMMLATANPTFLAPIGKDLTGKELTGIAAELNVGEHGIIAPTVDKNGTVNWTRSPYAPGASFFAAPYARTVANRYGLSNNSAMFNVEDFYTLNTGDFDGDFVWAYQTLKDDEDFKARTEERNRRVQELARKREEEEARIKAQNEAINGKQDAIVDHDVTGFGTATLRANNTLGPIGAGFKAGQAGPRMMDVTAEELAYIDDYGNKTYADAIDMVKHTDVRVAKALGVASDAMRTRQPIERMTDALLSEKETGSFGATDIFKYGLPTYIDPIGTSILAGATAGRRANVSYGDRIKTAIRDNIEHRYAGAYQEERDLADWYGNLLGGKLSGEFQISTLQDLSEGRARLSALDNRIKAISDNNPQAAELKDLQDLYRHADNAIKLEETLGYNEGNLESIRRYNAAMHWDNPIQKYAFKTKSEQDAATILFEREQAARIAESEQNRKAEIAQVISAQTGRVPGKVDEGYLADRLMAAHMFTGFNWSNAKNWIDGTLRANGAVLGGLRREDGATSTFDVDYNAAVEEENRLKYTHGRGMSRKEQVARQILTGESFTDADALVGLAAHAYMDAYGSARALSGRTSQGDIKTSAKEAADTAYAAFEEELLGKNGVLTDEQKKARKDAGGIAFAKDETGLITANYGVPEDQLTQVQKDTLTRINNKLALASRTNWANQRSSLDKTAAEFYEEAFTNAAGEHMIMTEGTPFELDENGRLQQVASRRREGHNGIWMRPTRDGKEVIDFERYSKDASGHTVVSNAGMYFTPDMIKKDDNGNITIVDWKSSQHGQKDALFQMGFYAHQLEQLGRQYHETGDENLKWFGQFVDKDTGRSRVTGLQAVNMFGKQGEQVLSYKYTQEWGDQVSKAVEGGMQSLAEDAKKGFYAQVKDDIGVRIGNRQVGGSRPTVAPEVREEDAHFSNLEEAGLINRLLNPLRMNDEVAAGRTGVKDSEGNYIDQDKSFLVAKYMKDKEELAEINAFANKQNRYLNNRSFEQLDPFTRNIDALRQKFGEQDYATIQKYMQNPLQYAPDLELMSKDFDQTQHEALQTTMRLMGLRRQYVDQLGETMPLDYNNILYGEGDQLSKLRSGTAKYQRDLSALQEVRAESILYNAKTGRFKTKEELDAEIEAQRENETQEQYNARVEQSRKENEDLAKESERLQTRYDEQEKSIREAFGTFEGGWIENFKKSAEYLDSGLGGLFKDGSIDAAVTGLQSRAREYTREADTKLPDETYVHGSDERNAIASLVTRLQERSQEFESLKGSSLESLLGFGREYNTARINAAMTGTQISAEDTRKKAIYDFANAFVRANPSASAQQLMESVGIFGNSYDKQTKMQEELRELHQTNALANINDQNIAREENLRRQFENANRQQYARYSTSRIANALYGVQQRRDSAQAQYDNLNRQAEAERRNQAELKAKMEKAPEGSKEYKDAANAYALSTERLKGLEAAAGTAKEQLNQLNGVGAAGKAVFGSLSQSVSMLITRFGRQLFQKALTEAKRFVKEFDQTMTSIQMITLKTNDQMSTLGDGLIDKAKELKISVSEVIKSAETLYRQGLSDEEVSERLDVISKFSKVSGTKVDAATKLITVAMNTGLATDPQMVADIVTALGDNAATNASEIEKGIEKAGAAAAADGTTFAQLASMLTAITSTTQMGGNVAGRTLNTIFGRMNKIGTSELITDENGNKISGSAVAKLLQGQGIRTYDEMGNKRSSYDVLYDLARKWDVMSDAEQQQIATAIAGTRQYSNFAAIMQGMNEGKVDEYMQLAGNASGITDKKYQIYVESLQASLTDLKNTFDNLVQDLTKSGIAQKVVKGLTNIVQGVDNLVNSQGGLEKIVGLMITLSIAMAALKSGNPYAMVAGAAVAGISLAALHASGQQAAETKKPDEILEESRTTASEKYTASTNEIERARELKAKGSSRTQDEEQEYSSLISKFRGLYSITGKAGSEYTDLGDTLSDASKHVEELKSATENLGSSAKSASEELSDYEEALINYYETKRNSDQIEAEYGDAPNSGISAANRYKELSQKSVEKTQGEENLEKYNGVLWNRNPETGEITLADNWYENLLKIRKNDISGSMNTSGAFMNDILAGAIDEGYITNAVGTGFGYTHYTSQRRAAEGLIDLFEQYSPYKKDLHNGHPNDWLFGEDYATYHRTAADDPHMQQFMEQIMLYVNQRASSYHPEDVQEDSYTAQAMEEMILPILPEDMKMLSPFIGKALAKRFSLEDALDPNKVFQDAYTYAIGGEENRLAKSMSAKRTRLFDLAAEGDFNAQIEERERQLKTLGIMSGQEGDYYIGEDGLVHSYEDVASDYEKYNNLINRQAWTYTRSGKESGQVYEVKQGMDFATPEEAEAYRQAEASSWYFKDNEGNITWADSEAAARAAQEAYIAAGNAQVRRSYYNPNTGKTETYEGFGKSEASDAFQAQYEADLAKAFEIRVQGTNQQYARSKTYGSMAQASQDAAIANALEAEAYQQRLATAEAARRRAIVELYGEEAGNLIYDQLTGSASGDTFVAVDKNNKFIKSFENEDLASQYQFENTEFINNATGESLGFGAKGQAAAQELEKNGAFLEYYIDGQYLGRGAEGLAEANRIRANGGLYKYTNGNGETQYTLDYEEAAGEANETAEEYYSAIQSIYEERLGDLLYDNAGSFGAEGSFGNRSGIAYVGANGLQDWATPYLVDEYTDENGVIRYKARHSGNVAYEEGDLDEQGRIKSLVQEAEAEYGAHGFMAPVTLSPDSIYTDTFNGISTSTAETGSRIERLKTYVDSLTGAIPDLGKVDPQVVLEVWGQLPEAIQEELVQTGEIGEEALETVRSATDAVLAAKPQYKTITNHFMAGVNKTYGDWETKNQYAVTADSMLRMITGNPEITDLQSLFNYVNTNDVSEWSTLNTKADFARLMAPIQLDHGIIQNSKEQQDEIYNAMIQLLYKNGLDYGARQLSTSQKAAYAQSGFDKIFSDGNYFESQNAAQTEAQRQAAADLKTWQDEYETAFNNNFYRKGLSQSEKNQGLSINKSGYVVDASGNLTGARIDENGFLVDIEGNKQGYYSEENGDFAKAKETFDQNYKNQHGFIDIVARENEYMRGYQWITDDERKYLEEAVGSGVYQRLFGPQANATDAEKAYAQMLISNRAAGLTELTAGQKADLSAQAYKDLTAGKVSEYSAMDETMRSNLLAGISGTSDLYQMALLLNQAGYTFQDAISGNISDENLNKALGGRYSANDLRSTNLSVSQASRLNEYRNAANYKDISTMFAGLTSQRQSEQLSTLQSIQQNQTKFARGNFALDQLDTTKPFEELDESIVGELSSVTGYAEEEIKKMWKADASGAKEKLRTALSAQTQELNDTLLATYDILAEGTDISSLGDNVDTETLAKYFDESNKALANYIRTVGLVIKDGKAQIDNGSESIFTTLKEAETSANAANRTKADALGLAKTVAFGATEGDYSGLNLQARAKKLIENNTQDLSAIDDNLRYMLNLAAQENSDVTETDLQQAYNNALFGGGSTASKYGYAGRKLFGENGFSGVTADSLESIRTAYQSEIENNGAESPLVKMWQAMLSDMGEAGSTIQDYLNGATLPDNFDQMYAEWLANEAFKGNRNAAENATNVGLLATGRASDRATVMGGYFSQMANAAKAQLAMASPLDLTKQEDIVSFLGLDKDFVSTQMQSDSGRANIQALINEKRADILSNMKEVIAQDLKGVDIDPNAEGIQELDLSETTDFDSLIDTLRSAAEHADEETAKRLNEYADALEGASSAASQDFAEAYQQAQQRLRESTYEYKGSKYIQEVASNYNSETDGNFWEYIKSKAGEGENNWNNDWNGAIMNNNGIVAAMSLLSSGGMSYPQFNQFMTDQMSGVGKNHDYYDLLAQTALGNNYQNGTFNSIGLDQTLDKMKGTPELRGFYDDLISRFPELEAAAKGSSVALDRLNSNWKADKVSEVTKYAKGVDGLADIMTDLAKGGNDATRAEMKLNAEMVELQDQQKAINKARGKTGKQLYNAKQKGDQTLDILAGMLPYDADQLANMSQQQLDELLNQAQPIISEQFADTIESLWNMLEPQHIDYPIGKLITVGVDGQLELTEFASQLNSEEQRILNIIMSLLGTYASVDVQALLSDGHIDVQSFLSSLKKSGVNTGGNSGYSRRSPKTSSGGKGKSKTDALIEGQGHYIKRREHDVTMWQERETRYEKTNNYQGYLDALNGEIEAQERLKDQYAANIVALKEQLGSLKTGTEEWYKCVEAIDAAEEAMAKIDNEIDNINSKKINIVETKQANQDKPISHASTMISLRAQNYLEKGQFENYEAVTRAQIANYNLDIEQNNVQIQEWEDLLSTFEEGTQDWMTIRDKIWALKEENAELENNILSETHALEQAKIAQIKTDLENMLNPFEHEQNMLSTWGGIYDKGHQYGAYRGALASQNAYNEAQKAVYQSAIDELRVQLDTLEEGSQAWLDARAALFEYQEALASTTAAIQENEAAIEQSYVDELTTKYQDAAKSAEHELSMAQIAAEGYKNAGDYTNYEHMLEVQQELVRNNLDVKKTGLAAMEQLLDSGLLKEGSDQWKALREQIMSLREEVAKGENDYAAFARQIKETRFEHAIEEFNKQDNITQHEIKMIQYEQTRYQNSGELTNYGHALEWDNATQKKRADAIKEQISLLKQQQEEAADDPELYNKIQNEVMKMEEQYSAVNNTIEKNNKLIEKNQEDIKKLAKNIEDTLDKEIKARDKMQREMLQGEVNVQNSILGVIKKARQDEWNLEKKTREEHKKTLQNEKNLIKERLQARKAAIDAEDKYEILAEYQKQLALISMDPTRSKDAKELRRKISDLQQELSWDITEQEAEAASEAIDDLIKSEDDYIKVHDEDLRELLEDSGNFMDEVKDVMGDSYDDYDQYLQWMKEHNEEYKNSSEETRKSMEQGWKDTWDKMYGHTETYWDQIMQTMSTKEEFLDFMKESQDYLNASDNGKWILEHQWSMAYDNYAASLIDNASFEDSHAILEKITEMKDWTYKVEPIKDFDYDLGSYSTALQYWYARPKDDTEGVAQGAIDEAYDDLSSVIGSEASLYESQEDKGASSTPTVIIELGDSGGGGYYGGGGRSTPSKSKPAAKHYEFYWGSARHAGYDTAQAAGSALDDIYNKEKATLDRNKANAYGYNQLNNFYKQAQKTIKQYKHGGIIDFTGPAWVDGSKQRPESILDAYDTETIRQLANALSFVRITPGISPSSEYFNSGNSTIGDINITINQAELKEDADFDYVARRIGKAFTKELNKEGFNLARYSF